jgi:hypothetical protein
LFLDIVYPKASPKSDGHEYDVYHLNDIMAFFDKYCK